MTVISGLMASSLYAHRRYRHHNSTKKIFQLYILQFYFLFILTPLVAVGLFCVAYEIISRPRDPRAFLPLSPLILMVMNIFSIVIGVIGTSIHSTATSIHQTLWPETDSEVFKTNEVFHGPLSHNMFYIGSILMGFCLAISELIHPALKPSNILLTTTVGILLGAGQGVGTIWSTQIRPSLIIALALDSIVLILVLCSPINLHYYPLVVTAIFYLTSIFVILGLYFVLLSTSFRKLDGFISHFFHQGPPLG